MATEPPPASPSEPTRTAVRAALRASATRDIVLSILGARLVMFAFVLIVLAIFRPQSLDAGMLGVWNQWDGPHFLEVAAHGYDPPADPARIVLLPLYPLTIAAGSLVLRPLEAAMAISLLATLAAGVGLYRLVRLDAPDRVGRLAVVAMIAFPTGYALVAPYSEGLFLALSIWSFLAMRNGDPRLAGILGGLAALTRIQGLFLLPALAIEYWVLRRRLSRDVLWLLAVAVGTLIYFGINLRSFGDPFSFLGIQDSTFHVHNAPPWVAIQDLVRGILRGPPSEHWLTTMIAPLASFILLAVVTGWAAVSRHSRPSYALYAAINLLAFASLSFAISVPRYILGVFPIFIALGSVYRGPLGQALLLGSALLLGTFTTLFVMGHWAF